MKVLEMISNRPTAADALVLLPLDLALALSSAWDSGMRL
jgi:hypothetical protein